MSLSSCCLIVLPFGSAQDRCRLSRADWPVTPRKIGHREKWLPQLSWAVAVPQLPDPAIFDKYFGGPPDDMAKGVPEPLEEAS